MGKKKANPLRGKYVVFKADEFDEWAVDSEISERPDVLLDAIVLRGQDYLVPPVLWQYAQAATTAADIIAMAHGIETEDDFDKCEGDLKALLVHLRESADEFANAAEWAEGLDRKFPD